MIPLSYRSPKTEVRESKIHGRGLFAIADIAKDEIVAVKGGHIVDGKTLREKITPVLGPVEIQIDDDLFIAPVTDEERELSMLYSNHSCDPNLGMRGEITFVAMRDICAGEELTHDWAMTDDDDYSIECNCGAPDCRKTLTGKDWQRPDLQERYAGYFSAYLARKIAALAGNSGILPDMSSRLPSLLVFAVRARCPLDRTAMMAVLRFFRAQHRDAEFTKCVGRHGPVPLGVLVFGLGIGILGYRIHTEERE